MRKGTPADAIQSRPILGRLGAAIRRGMTAGESAEAIASRLHLDVARVRDFLDRLTPRYDIGRCDLRRARRPCKHTHPPRGRKLTAPAIERLARLRDQGLRLAELADVAGVSIPTLTRALRGRPRRFAWHVSEWSLRRGPGYRDDPGIVEPSAIATRPGMSPDCAPPDPAPAEAWERSPSGRRSPAAALSDEDAAIVRALRAAGVPRADVAARFGVSVATVTRITRGETYGPVALEYDQVVTIDPPAIAEALPSAPAAWIEPRHRGPEWRDD